MVDPFDKDIIDMAADGKFEHVEGKEPLKKDPKKKKKGQRGVMTARWNELKKALDNSKAILDLKAEQQEEPEEAQPDQSAPEQEQAQPPQGEQPDDAQSAPAEEAPEEQEPAQQSEADQKGDDEDEEPSDEEKGQLTESLKQHGYSDAEIAYIVHGHHSPEIDVAKDAKAKATNAMSGIETGAAEAEAKQKLSLIDQESKQKLSQEQKMHETEYEHKKRMADLEYKKSEMDMPDPEGEKKHKQRMQDLEYEMKRSSMKDNGPEKEHAKRMSDLEFESKKSDMPNPKHKQRMEDVEYETAKAGMPNNEFEMEHKKKMLELEYNFEKEAKKLELEFKKKEHQQKLKLAEDGMKQKAKEGDAKHKVRLADAKKPKPKTPLKKHQEDPDGEPYDGHFAECEDPDCEGCWVEGAPYDGEEVEKLDNHDPTQNPTYQNKAKKERQRGVRRDNAEQAAEVPKKLNPPTDVKVPYIDIGTPPTKATPSTQPKMR